jgi:hypothetical protein
MNTRPNNGSDLNQVKKSYHAPRLVSYGNLKTLTQSKGAANNDVTTSKAT